MLIGVKQASELLAVSEKTIYRWIADGKIPHTRVGKMYRFSKSELVSWASSSHRTSQTPTKSGNEMFNSFPSVSEALGRGGIYYRIGGSAPAGAIREIVSVMRLPDGIDREKLFSDIVERESLASTGIGEGAALPHPRNPLLNITEPLLTLAFPEKPIDWNSIDGKKVTSIFLLCSPDVKSHLNMLARINSLMRDAEWKKLISEAPMREEILDCISSIESSFNQRAG